jgi:ribonucleoside-diphosphate reductase alpha chain
MRLRYGSPEAIQFIDNVYKTICIELYRTSALLAKEKGAFPKCNAEKFLQSGFCRQLPQEIQQLIREHGIRNVTLTTQAPTGTVGTMLGTSTGIEPYYAFEFYRQSRLGLHKVDIPLAKQYRKVDGTLPDYFVTALELTPLDHIRVQAAVQRWTDSSISKTANAPEHFTITQTKELYEQAYDLGCKGVTIYRDNSRSEQILSTDTKEEKKQDHPSAAGICTLERDEHGQIRKSCSE